MVEGWVRYVLEAFEFGYRTTKPDEVARVDIAGEFDVIVLPDGAMGRLSKERLLGSASGGRKREAEV